MALGNPLPLLLAKKASYQIEKSLRFDGSGGYLTKTPTAGDRNDWTFSCWYKPAGGPEVSAAAFVLFQADTSTVDTYQFSDSKLHMTIQSGSDTGTTTRGVLRDSGSWYHIVSSYDGSNLKLYINGVLDKTTSHSGDTKINSNVAHYIGQNGSSARYLPGYLAEFHFIDGTALDHESFGETDSITGAWVPKKYTGSHGSQGYYLKFDDTSNFGLDSSGNGNNWTANGFSTSAGTGYDSFTDTPTNNFCTLNSLENGYGTATYSNGNLEVAASNAWVPMRGSMAVRSGKYYWEVYGADGNTFIGVAPINTDLATINPMLRDGVIVYYGSDGKKRIDGTFTTYGSAYGSSNVIGVALDIDNGKLYFSEDNTWQNSGDPTSGATGTGAINLSDATGLVGSDIIPFFCKNGTQFQVNFGQRAFTHTPPTGYTTLCSANLPVPAIKNGKKHFKSVLYIGNDGSQNVDVGFQPSAFWVKDRDSGYNHAWTNFVTNTYLYPNLPDNEGAIGSAISQLSNGFNLNTTSNVFNNNNDDYVAWAWKESASAGLDIVSYAGNGQENTDVEIAHNLGVSPAMVIVKNRTSDSTRWQVWHKDLTAGKNLLLNTDAIETTYTSYIKAVSDTTFTVRGGSGGGNLYVNQSGQDYLAYVFENVEGFSSFGSYEGNGVTDGTFVYTGFRPSLVILKRIETTPNAYWNIYDTARDPYNSTTTADFKRLLVQSSGAEVTNHANYTPPDLLSNGFKLRHGSADKNYSGKKFIYLAFAETPFKYANAR